MNGSMTSGKSQSISNGIPLNVSGIILDCFVDNSSRYFRRNYSITDNVVFYDCNTGNHDYANIINGLNSEKISYRLRKARLDNSVRIMIKL